VLVSLLNLSMTSIPSSPQTAIRVSNEPPSDIKSNMRRAWAAFPPEFFARASTEPKRRALRSIIFGLCFFHSVLLGRKKYGTGEGCGRGGTCLLRRRAAGRDLCAPCVLLAMHSMEICVLDPAVTHPESRAGWAHQ
jgi:hypothetical protein